MKVNHIRYVMEHENVIQLQSALYCKHYNISLNVNIVKW